MAALEIRLLGAIEARRDGHVLPLPGQRVRTLLAVLALSAGRTVTVDRIADALWDDRPPERVRGSLQTYVGRLRRAVGADLVRTDPTGYALLVPRAAVDLLDFADRIDAIGDLTEPAQERRELGDLLAAWTGEPFGMSGEWLNRYEAPLWTERRLQAVERRADLDLAAGSYNTCALELQSLITDYPLRESLWHRWLSALQGAGRTADALTQYDLLRRRLSDDLGTDPSDELQRLHQGLLAGGPAPTRSTPAAAPALEQPRDVPRNLPVEVSGFTGRRRELDALDRARTGGAAQVVVLHGPAGTGKTTTAVHWAHQVADDFPDGQVFLSLRGFGPGEPLGHLEALGLLLAAVGVPRSRLPSDEDQRAALWRRTVADRRLLVVLDNARESAHVRPLLPGGRSLAVVTSRSQLRSLSAREGATRIWVDAMSATEAIDLLLRRLPRPAAHDDVARLAELCDHLPLALAVAAERAGRDERRPLGDLISQLEDDRQRLARLTAWEDDPQTSVRAVLDWSYRTLSADAAHLLRRLEASPDSRTSVATAAALAGSSTASAEDALDRLTDCHLLQESSPGWYEIHDLVRAFAADLAARTDTSDERAATVRRVRSWYVHSAANALDQVAAAHPIVTLPVAESGVVPEEFADSGAAFAWFRSHRTGLGQLVQQAADTGDHATAYTIVPVLSTFLGSGGFAEEVRLLTIAESSARADGDTLAQAVCAAHLGMAHGRSQQFVAAREWFLQARGLYARAEHRAGELHVMMTLGVVLTRDGDVTDAVALLQETLRGAHELGLESREAATLNNLAVAHTELGHYPEAIQAAERSIALHDRLGNPLNEAMALDTLGVTHLRAGDVEEASDALARALAIHQRTGEGLSHATALKDLGRAHAARGSDDEARACWVESLAMLDRVDASDSPDCSRAELRALLGGAQDAALG